MIRLCLFITLVSLSFSTISDCREKVTATNRECHTLIRQTKGDHRSIPKKGFVDSKVLSKHQFSELVDAASGTETGKLIRRRLDRLDRRYAGHEVVFFEFNHFAFRNYLFTQGEKDRVRSAHIIVTSGDLLSANSKQQLVEGLDVLVAEIEIPLPKNKSMHLVYDSHVLLVDNAKIIGVLWNGKNSEDTLVSLEIGFTKNLAIGYMSSEFEFKDHEYLSLKVVHSGYNAVVQRNPHADLS